MAKKGKSLQRPVTPPEDLFSAPQASAPEEEPEEEKQRTEKRTTTKNTKSEAKSEESVQVSVYMPESWLSRLDLLKHKERDRLKAENKRATRSTIIREAIREYLERKEK